MNKALLSLSLLSLPLLAGCISDGAAYNIAGPDHSISITREQNFFWDKKVKFSLVAARLPDCQRVHVMQAAPRLTKIELWQPGPGTFILKQGDAYFLTETQTCLGFQKLEAAPQEGLGDKLGVFEEKGDRFVFTPEPAPATPAAPAGATPAEGGAAPASAGPQ